MPNDIHVIANICGLFTGCVRTTSQGIVRGMDKPQQPREGKLIADAIKTHGISIRTLAKEAGYSEGRVRQVINGYASAGKGQFIKVTAPDEALAKIAWAAGLTVYDLRMARRPDAAEVLATLGEKWYEEQRRPAGDIGRVDVDAIKQWATDPLGKDVPESILELYPDHVLIQELHDRMVRYRVDIKDYVALVTRLTREAIEDDKKEGGNDGSQASPQKNPDIADSINFDIEPVTPQDPGTDAAEDDT